MNNERYLETNAILNFINIILKPMDNFAS